MAAEKKEKIAIFGFHDSIVGQFLAFSDVISKYEIAYFLACREIPDLNIEEEHRTRPNDKTEFVVNKQIFGKPVYHDKDFTSRLIADNINKVFVLEEDIETRETIFNELSAHRIEPQSYIHPNVFLGGKNFIGKGVIIFPNCNIGYKTDIKQGTIMQPFTLIYHHNLIGQFCNIAPRVTTGGFTEISDKVTINLGANIINRIKVGSRCVIGAGSLVLKDCGPDSVYVGSPAKLLKKQH